MSDCPRARPFWLLSRQRGPHNSSRKNGLGGRKKETQPDRARQLGGDRLAKGKAANACPGSLLLAAIRSSGGGGGGDGGDGGAHTRNSKLRHTLLRLWTDPVHSLW